MATFLLLSSIVQYSLGSGQGTGIENVLAINNICYTGSFLLLFLFPVLLLGQRILFFVPRTLLNRGSIYNYIRKISTGLRIIQKVHFN